MRFIALISTLFLVAACGADGEPETPQAAATSDSPQDTAAEALL
ncbi:MAG: argininosuccinate lyase [Rhodobacterales bacterium]|nr:argininosuccinate lyase [Rhodobacterales bacterium]